MSNNSETFTYEQDADLALMIYHRFGRNMVAASAAWGRLLRKDTCNNDYVADFIDLLVDAASRLPQNAAIRELLAV